MINYNILLYSSKKQLKQNNIFGIGFILYTLSYALSQTHHVSFKIIGGFQLLGLILLISSAIILLKFKFDNQYLQIIFFLYLFWLTIIILRGFSLSLDTLKSTFFNASYGILIYAVPLFLLLPKNLIFYKKIFDIIIILGVFYLVYDFVFIHDLLSSDRSSDLNTGIVENSSLLSIPACFLLLTFNYHSLRRQLFAIAVVILTLFFAIIRARRGLIFICISQITFSYILFLYSTKKKFFIIISSILILFIGSVYVGDIYLQKKNNIFSFLMERGKEDTRTGVEIYFYEDMKDKDWVIGKGFNGQYFCPDIDENDVTGYRDVIETGYLQIILKGGFISLGLLLLIAIPAIFKGLFYSKNILSKASGLWILLWVMYLYPASMEGFYLYYLLVWISIGICYSKKIRNLSEENIKRYFRSTDYIEE